MGNRCHSFTRQRVGSDGYIVEETWISNEDGKSAPLNSIYIPNSEHYNKLSRGESVDSWYVRHAINQYNKERRK